MRLFDTLGDAVNAHVTYRIVAKETKDQQLVPSPCKHHTFSFMVFGHLRWFVKCHCLVHAAFTAVSNDNVEFTSMDIYQMLNGLYP